MGIGGVDLTSEPLGFMVATTFWPVFYPPGLEGKELGPRLGHKRLSPEGLGESIEKETIFTEVAEWVDYKLGALEVSLATAREESGCRLDPAVPEASLPTF